MARKLKVFSWSDGLHVYAVATTSRAKALAAWDIGRDLFKDGAAKEISEGPAHDAALAKPETVITQAAGGLDAALKALPARARRAPSKADAARAEKLAGLKAQLEAVEDEAEASELAFAERRAALDAEESDAVDALEAKRTKLSKAIKALGK
jgi:hypothetical protein